MKWSQAAIELGNVNEDGVTTFRTAGWVVPDERAQTFCSQPRALLHQIKNSLLNPRQRRQLCRHDDWLTARLTDWLRAHYVTLRTKREMISRSDCSAAFKISN